MYGETQREALDRITGDHRSLADYDSSQMYRYSIDLDGDDFVVTMPQFLIPQPRSEYYREMFRDEIGDPESFDQLSTSQSLYRSFKDACDHYGVTYSSFFCVRFPVIDLLEFLDVELDESPIHPRKVRGYADLRRWGVPAPGRAALAGHEMERTWYRAAAHDFYHALVTGWKWGLFRYCRGGDQTHIRYVAALDEARGHLGSRAWEWNEEDRVRAERTAVAMRDWNAEASWKLSVLSRPDIQRATSLWDQGIDDVDLIIQTIQSGAPSEWALAMMDS